MTIKVRGIDFHDNLDNPMGLEFVNLSHRWGYQCPNWPYFQDVKIERIHYMAKSGVLSQRITTSLFLASRASDFYTGHILYADGGYTAG